LDFQVPFSFHRAIAIAIGEIRHSGQAGTYQGRVKVFHLIHEDEFIDKWELVREPLEGERLLYYFGYMGVPTNTKAMRK